MGYFIGNGLAGCHFMYRRFRHILESRNEQLDHFFPVFRRLLRGCSPIGFLYFSHTLLSDVSRKMKAYFLKLKITERMLGIAMIAGAIDAVGCEKAILSPTTPNARTATVKDSICPMLFILTVFSKNISSCLRRWSASFSAMVSRRSAAPGNISLYTANSLAGGRGPEYETCPASVCNCLSSIRQIDHSRAKGVTDLPPVSRYSFGIPLSASAKIRQIKDWHINWLENRKPALPKGQIKLSSVFMFLLYIFHDFISHVLYYSSPTHMVARG